MLYKATLKRRSGRQWQDANRSAAIAATAVEHELSARSEAEKLENEERYRSESMKFRVACAIAVASALGGMSAAYADAPMRTDEELIKVLKTAAPPEIVEQATIMNMHDGKMVTIQEGTNGWTCMDPGGHGKGEPMCADKAAMAWAGAWQNKKDPPAELGFMYMLAGDSGVSNTDPYNTDPAPTDTNNWVQTGPHVMIVGTKATEMMKAYPRDAKPDPTKPYVMWPDTPYEHLMIPVNP
jgi:hypothetical protein